MTVVVDTSVIVKWFHAENEAEVDESRAILAAHRDEILTAHVLELGIYEALFVAAAQALGAPLIGMNRQLLAADLAQTPAPPWCRTRRRQGDCFPGVDGDSGVDRSGVKGAIGGGGDGRWVQAVGMGEFIAPLRGSDAVAAGMVSWGQLRGPGFRRLFPDIYLPENIVPTLAMRSRSAFLLVAEPGPLAGYSAAELLGARIAPRDADAEVVTHQDLRVRRGLRVHREQLADDEVETVGGLVVTSAVRTAYDLARWSTLVEGVVAADALGRIGRFGPSDLLGMATRYPGARWRTRVPLVAELMDPRAESAMETRCRLSLVLRGLPKPELQYRVCDELGDHVAWLDMAYPSARAGVEFDGEHHQNAPTFRADLARHNRLATLGWTVLRASATDVLRNPDRFAAQVRAVLHQRSA